MFIFNVQVKIYMGDGWHLEFHRTHFDRFSPPDFFAKVSYLLGFLAMLKMQFQRLHPQYLGNGLSILKDMVRLLHL